MKIKKGYTKRNVTFLNTPKSGCMAACSWTVTYYPRKMYTRGTKKGTLCKAEMDANISFNDEAKNHYISDREGLKALKIMRKELDAFEGATLAALQDVEIENATS